jgi:phosphatidylethanolamine-binding protein (PEBP) family uncharacterized protein
MKKRCTLLLALLILGFPISSFATTTNMQLTSPVFSEMGKLPALYTCDGSSISPPLEWKNVPKNAKYLALTMYTIPKDGPDHWYFTIWDIPSNIKKLPEGNLNIGQVGGNGENPNIGYAPPCSKGPGPKKYTFSLYALSRSANLGKSSARITRANLLAAISKITLAEANLDVIYSRPNGVVNDNQSP